MILQFWNAVADYFFVALVMAFVAATRVASTVTPDMANHGIPP